MHSNVRTIIFLVFICLNPVRATELVTVYPEKQRFVGSVSELDRAKYFTIHANGKDPFLLDFCHEYNVSFGRGFQGPGAEAKRITGQVGEYPTSGSLSIISPAGDPRYVMTDHPRNAYREGMDVEAFGRWVATYFKNIDSSKRPLWYEPMNEPFVHAREFYDEPDWDPVAEIRVKTEMSHLFKAAGKYIRAEPALSELRVLGYGAAFPSFERKDFQQWKTNMKLFLDIAGEYMDAISYHLYDGINQVGQYNIRSGSNNDAIMDLVETYSMAKWGVVKPHAITEYGAVEQSRLFSVIENMQSIRSQNAMLFGLLEREDRMEISIPFTVDKAGWHINASTNYMPFKSVLIRPLNVGVPLNQVKSWVFTDRIHFYKLWKDVKGKRVYFTTSNPDIQAQAFVDKDKLYVALNNLDDVTRTVKVDIPGFSMKLKQVLSRSLVVYTDKFPVFEEKILKKAPDEIVLEHGQTVVLEYTYANNIVFNKTVKERRYYNPQNVVPIIADSILNYKFNGVDTGNGVAWLSMSLGREHHHSKKPKVTFNGHLLTVPDNWKGYDQKPRFEFFGAIEIPVPVGILKSENRVTLKFEDNGGHLSSLILNMAKFE
ncbi:MAG: beta-porphyranase A [Paludibacter sp.]|jgi:hypothetical protein|nr:beta-porphyranase A [Paludibacter sp.]